jgi:hypothetical protein
MSRSLLARSLEPLVAISWAIFLVWSIWLAAVWALGINQSFLGLPISSAGAWDPGAAGMVEDAPAPPHAGLRRAVLLLAEGAELAWFALALIQLHLSVISINGVNTARAWMGISLGGALLLGLLNRAIGLPFGWIYFSPVLGAQLSGVPLGWVLMWGVLVIGARESVLRFAPRISHLTLSFVTAGGVLVTIVNLVPIAKDVRAWWGWHTGDIRQPAPTPWWFWPACFIVAWLLAFLMRERTIAAGMKKRSLRPLVVLLTLNFAALLTHAHTRFR